MRRRVALKVIKLGMDTKQVIARFEAERQALALMHHPHIAGVIDAGATAGGRPYFVMELVEGEPIARYCSEHRLSIEQRLELFGQVCAAVQHAHAKGVIHRDLKPGNILVRTQDGKAFAKVIDFGIAKATVGRLTDRTLATEAELMMGTPTYMSPEQAAGSADIDTRTDVYSLGVILYELLTDSTPLDGDTVRAAGYDELQRLIREVEPPRPSARLSQTAARRDAQAPGGDTRVRAGEVRGELDWIAMKAIEKDRSRRYESAAALAEDVRRYLGGEPVLAVPPGRGYRFGKFVRRNKLAVATASLAALALIAGLAATAWQAREARARADELQDVTGFQAHMLEQLDPPKIGAMLSADVKRHFAAGLARTGVPEAERAQRSAAFSAQWDRIDATATAIDLVDHAILSPAAATIDAQFKDLPLVDVALRESLADRYVQMGLFDTAVKLQRAAFAIEQRELGDDARTFKSMGRLGQFLQTGGAMAEAEPLLRKALAGQRRLAGPDAPDMLDTENGLALLLYQTGRLKDAEPLAREAVAGRRKALGASHPDTLTSINNLALILQDEGRLIEAEGYFKQALDGARRTFGPDNDQTIFMVNNMAMLLQRQQKLAEAETYSREAMQRARRVWGGDHPYTLEVLNNFGHLLQLEGKLGEADPVLREALAKNRRVQGDDNPDTLISIDAVGALDIAEGRFEDAESLLAPAEAAMRKTFTGDDARRLGVYLMHRGKARTALRRFEAAERDLLEGQPLIAKAPGASERVLREADGALADLYANWDAVEPGNGHGAKAAEWKGKAEGVGKGK